MENIIKITSKNHVLFGDYTASYTTLDEARASAWKLAKNLGQAKIVNNHCDPENTFSVNLHCDEDENHEFFDFYAFSSHGVEITKRDEKDAFELAFKWQDETNESIYFVDNRVYDYTYLER